MPELGFEERETGRLVLDAVSQLAPGVVARPIAGTGLLISVSEARPLVLLRGCLDALPVEDATNAEYASTAPGRSHACGHDGQIAVLLGAVALLARAAPPFGVAALFQPAEELDTGARAVIDDGLFDLVDPAVMLGFHGHPGLPAGTFAAQPGPVMASITTVRCRIHGHAGHGAEPHLTADAATAAASLVLDWQVVLGRRVDPRQPVVLSVGRIAAGTTPNVVPGYAEVDATLRCLDPAVEPVLQRLLSDVVRGVEMRTGTTIELQADPVVPAVVNDEGVAAAAAAGVADLFGAAASVHVEPTLGGDDFAWYLERVPGCYVFLGERAEGRAPYGWHDPAYDLDERSLVMGSAVLASMTHRVAEAAANREAEGGSE